MHAYTADKNEHVIEGLPNLTSNVRITVEKIIIAKEKC